MVLIYCNQKKSTNKIDPILILFQLLSSIIYFYNLDIVLAPPL